MNSKLGADILARFPSLNLIEAAERTRRGNFSQAGLRGFELRGKTRGVIGTGRIGASSDRDRPRLRHDGHRP